MFDAVGDSTDLVMHGRVQNELFRASRTPKCGIRGRASTMHEKTQIAKNPARTPIFCSSMARPNTDPEPQWRSKAAAKENGQYI